MHLNIYNAHWGGFVTQGYHHTMLACKLPVVCLDLRFTSAVGWQK